MNKYKLGVVGGTFDHFHRGHEQLLAAAFISSEQVLIGLASDLFIGQQSNKIGTMQSFAERQALIESYLMRNGFSDRAIIRPFDLYYGPEEWQGLPIEVIYVTNDTAAGARAVNTKRLQDGQKLMEIEVVPLLRAEDGKDISSTRIRSGLIGPEGKVYRKLLGMKDLFLSPEGRSVFQEPLGEIRVGINFNKFTVGANTVTVGDYVSRLANEAGLLQALSVIDYRERRQLIHSSPVELGFDGSEQMHSANNPAGQITQNLIQTLEHAFTQLAGTGRRQLVLVSGEEDLAVMPLVLLLPLGWSVLYGQPDEGFVELLITTELKEQFVHLLRNNFTVWL
jgi:phosphopantetheine adenylyltransferase/uncharacterized protein (UPF0218 family)